MTKKLLTTYFIITMGIFLMGAATWKTDLVDVLQDLRDAITGNPDISSSKYELHIADNAYITYKFDTTTGDTWIRSSGYLTSKWNAVQTN